MLEGALAGLPLWAILTIAFVIGLLVGSFLNVVIHRIPRGQSIVSPGSACPACLVPIRPIDNIPLLSFLALRGRCRNCHERIAFTYPLVELITAALFAIIIWLHGPTLRSMGEWWFCATMVAVVVIDTRHHLLPDRITYPSLVIALIFAISRVPMIAELEPLPDLGDPGFSPWRTALLGASVIVATSTALWLLDQLDIVLFDKYYDWIEPAEDGPQKQQEVDEDIENQRYTRLIRSTAATGVVLALIWSLLVMFDSSRDTGLYQIACSRLIGAALGAVIGASVLWLVRAAYFYLRGIEGMGLGDVKLMAVVGAFLGWPGAVFVLLLASIIGLIVGLGIARKSGDGLKTELPLGACLGSAAILVLIVLDVGLYSGI